MSFTPQPGTGEITADPLLSNPGNWDFEVLAASPCVNAADPALVDPDGTRRDMGACHHPFISLSCTPSDYFITPGGTLELMLVAENELAEASFPVRVSLVARLPNGNEYPVFGPFPPAGVSIPALSVVDGTLRLPVPSGMPVGLEIVLKSVLSRADTGEYVDMDRCDLEVAY